MADTVMVSMKSSKLAIHENRKFSAIWYYSANMRGIIILMTCKNVYSWCVGAWGGSG